MKAIMVMFDSLNLRMLEPYGCDWVRTPNFTRLAERSVTFDCNYVGSLPCMPARRELHTGRTNFLHRGWGPMEPYDDSMPEILKNNGVYTHLVSDHQHYWEDGGCTYHNRYSSWDCVRGQEGDAWKVLPELIEATHKPGGMELQQKLHRHDAVNRKFIRSEEQMPQAKTFRGGLEFLENNWGEAQWFLQIETFDPHEPFFTQEEYKKFYEHEYQGPLTDWPPYYFVTEGEAAVRHIRYEYAALMTMCDHYLGKVLDFMDEHHMWEDTMLIVNTDHGYLLGEHGWWSKTIMPVYEEIARTPLFVYDPRLKLQGEHRDALTQAIDLPATLLEFFDLPLPEQMMGKPLRSVMESNQAIREYALFGFHEGHMNLTDGRYVYMKAPVEGRESDLYEYTLMPTHMRSMFAVEELQNIRLEEPFSFTKGCRTMKIRAKPGMTNPANYGTRLYDLQQDPMQECPIEDFEKEAELANAMTEALRDNDSPKERYLRFGLKQEGKMTPEDMKLMHEAEGGWGIPASLKELQWSRGAGNMYGAIKRLLPKNMDQVLEQTVKKQAGENYIGEDEILAVIDVLLPEKNREMARYFAMLNSRTN